MTTLIDWDGREFELPKGDMLDLYEGRVNYVTLKASGGGASLFAVREVEARGEDTLVVYLGDEMGKSGPVGWEESTGYPIPPLSDFGARGIGSRIVESIFGVA